MMLKAMKILLLLLVPAVFWPGSIVAQNLIADLNGANEANIVNFTLSPEDMVQKTDTLVINEFMASNSSYIQDPQGHYDDWIEIYNYGTSAVNIGRMYLTDNLSVPTRWRIPDGNPAATTIPPQGYLLIWADNDTTDSGLHANFKISTEGEEIGLFDTNGNTLIDSVAFGDQTTDISYGRYPDANDNWRFFGLPSPGKQNIGAYLGEVADTKFSQDRGFYDTPFSVTITTETEDAVIYYTLDGSEPYHSAHSGGFSGGMVYTNPIGINKTTCLRIRAIKPGWKPTNMDAQTYIFLDDVIRQDHRATLNAGFPGSWGGTSPDYGMDPDVIGQNGEDLYDRIYTNTIRDDLKSIPTLSIAMNIDDMFGPEGIYTNSTQRGQAWERPASVELIYPDGREGFQVNCGIRIHGGYFRQHNATKKHSFRLLFKGIYGPTKLQYPLFGKNAVDSFETIVLRAGANDGYSWNAAVYTEQYTRDEFGRSLQRATGNASAHGIFVHLYINGIYWGLYNPIERPDNAFSASYYGGDKEDWDAIHEEAANNGDKTAWNQMIAKCRQAANSDEAYQELQGNNPDGTPNPAYPNLLDITNYIDYLIVNLWGGNWDWPWKNWWAGRDRSQNSTGFKFYCWDYENTIGNNLNRSPLTKNALNNNFSQAGLPHQSLKQNVEYRLLFADHVHKFFFNGGILTPESLIARYANLAAGVERAIVAESARWGDQHRHPPLTLEEWYDCDSNYNDGRAGRDWILNYYLPQRSDIVLQQFRNAGLYPDVDAPVFRINGSYQHGGHISKDNLFSMTAAAGTIWYTLDGSDPRTPGTSNGGISTILATENAAKRVLVPTDYVSSSWKGGGAFNDSAWRLCTGSPGGVGYEAGSGYQSYISLDVKDQMYNGNTTCYIRIPFTVNANGPAGFDFMTLKMRYDDGFIAYLNGTEVARRNFSGTPAWNSRALAQNSDSSAVVFEDFNLSSHLNVLRRGENILAIQGLNQRPSSSDFLISAELTVAESVPINDLGISPSAIRYTKPFTLDKSTHVKSRLLHGSTWSALNEATFAVGPVADYLRITEIMYHPQSQEDPNAEFIELKNIGAETLNLNLVSFTNGIDFTFPNLELAGDEYILVVKDLNAFAARYGIDLNIAGQYSGSLDNRGERIELIDAADGIIHDFEYENGWYDITDGLGFSLSAKDPTSTDPDDWDSKSGWRPSAGVDGSPGWDDSDSVPTLGNIVINELLANSHAGTGDWVELHNTTESPINISGWFLSDSKSNFMKYEIAAGTTIEPYGYIVFYEDLHFGNPSAPGCIVPFALNKNGETLYLHSAQEGVLTGYSEQEKFGTSGTGIAFGRYRKSVGTYNFVAMNRNTPGSTNAYPKVGPIVISEIMYYPDIEADVEYVELYNISGSPVTLAEYDNEQSIYVPWRFTDSDGISFDLPLDTTMAAGEYLLLVKNKNALNSRYPAVPIGAQIFEWGPGRLDNGGEKVEISKPADEVEGTRYYIRVDHVNYSDGSHPVGQDLWPSQPDGWGASLSRVSSQHYGNDPNNWTAAYPPTPGW